MDKFNFLKSSVSKVRYLISTKVKPNREVIAPLALIMALTSTLLLSFNNCSDVSFKTNTLDSIVRPVGDPEPGGGGGGSGGGNNPPSNLKSYVYDGLVPAYADKADLFFVLDNSGSMSAELQKLGERMDGLVATLDAAGIDWQMCFTTTDIGRHNGLAQQWLQKSQSGSYSKTSRTVIYRADADRAARYLDTMTGLLSQGTGSGTEEGIKAAYRAVTTIQNEACFRSDAALSVILISDEDERSTGNNLTLENQPSNFTTTVNNLWPEKSVFYHSIIWRPNDNACSRNGGANVGNTYAQLTAATGGILGDICATSYADQLINIGTRTTEGLKSINLQCAPYGAPQVTLTPASAITWRVEGNKIIFASNLPAGTRIVVNYQCAE